MHATVVIADDDPVMRALLAAYLGDVPSFDVVAVVDDGDAAVTATREHRPDLLLLDLEMPVRDGFDVLATLRAAAVDVRVVVLSGASAETRGPEAIGCGADAYIEKGVALPRVVDALDAVLGRAPSLLEDARILTADR